MHACGQIEHLKITIPVHDDTVLQTRPKNYSAVLSQSSRSQHVWLTVEEIMTSALTCIIISRKRAKVNIPCESSEILAYSAPEWYLPISSYISIRQLFPLWIAVHNLYNVRMPC